MILKAILAITIFSGISFSSSLYNIQITTMDGLNKPMSDFQGKKLLVIVLPVNRTAADSLYLSAVDLLSKRYKDSVNIIGVPAYEYGYQDANLISLNLYYRSILGLQVTLAKGMYVMKSSGSRQHPLFSWLTHAGQNNQFDQEVKGVGQKYFINGNGDLYAVLSSVVTIRDALMREMLY